MKRPAMKRTLLATTVALFASAASAQVSTYGRLDVPPGMPRPETIETKPVSAERTFSSIPVYVRVRPGEEKHWKRNCSLYQACNVPVLFVRDDWYHAVYEPRYQQRMADDASERSANAEKAKRAGKAAEEEEAEDLRYKVTRGAGKAAPLRPPTKTPPPTLPPQ